MQKKQTMDKKSLIEKIDFLQDKDKIAAKLYFHYSGKDGDVLLVAPTKNDSVDQKIAKLYTDSVLSKFNMDKGFHLLDINNVEEYDTVATHYYYENNYPQELNILFSKNTEEFKFGEHQYADIKGYLIKLSFGKDTLSLYKYRHNFDIHIKPTLLTLIRMADVLTSPSNESIIINEKFDYVVIENYLIAISLSTLERKIKFDERVNKESKEVIESIKLFGIQIVEGYDKLEEFLLSDFNFAKKLKSVDFNSLLWTTPFKDIKTRIEKKPQLIKYLKFNKTGDKFEITSKQGARIFFKLCNDKVMESILSGNILLVNEVESIE